MISITSKLCNNILLRASLNIKDAHNQKKKEKRKRNQILRKVVHCDASWKVIVHTRHRLLVY
jgi:hypothetical protein